MIGGFLHNGKKYSLADAHMRDFRVFKKVLSPGEIKKLYNAKATELVAGSDCVMWLQLNEGSGKTLKDSSGRVGSVVGTISSFTEGGFKYFASWLAPTRVF